ncbi:MAG: radical SAM protein [Muribaculaceae bacterium]|nr:radical SAM protein [Muribaculaceae bacterium]
METELTELINLHKSDIQELEDIHPEFFTALLNEGFVVENDSHDTALCIDKVAEKYHSLDNIIITINPTLDCNLRCWYCYEERHGGSIMSEQTIEHTINYINSILNKRKTKSIRLSFFGGEPLIYYKQVINPILAAISETCRTLSIEFFISFTTNGLLITDHILTNLKRYSSNISFQIAFDGAKEFHDSIKYTKAGYSCYDHTIANAKKALDNGYNVTIRCNYSKKSILSFVSVVEQFKEYHNLENLRFLFQKIWQEENDEELLDLRKRITQVIDSKFSINSNLHKLLGNSITKCYADYAHNFVINYDGHVYKCTARDFNANKSIGKITSSGLVLYTLDKKTNSLPNIPYGKKCTECRIMPICPSCAQSRIEHEYDSCPNSIDEPAMIKNIRAAFQDVSGIKLSNHT